MLSIVNNIRIDGCRGRCYAINHFDAVTSISISYYCYGLLMLLLFIIAISSRSANTSDIAHATPLCHKFIEKNCSFSCSYKCWKWIAPYIQTLHHTFSFHFQHQLTILRIQQTVRLLQKWFMNYYFLFLFWAKKKKWQWKE